MITDAGDEMLSRTPKETLPRPTMQHHVVEDFLTSWTSQLSHVTPLRHFLQHVTGQDLRMRFASHCFLQTMTAERPSVTCADRYLQGGGLVATDSMRNALK